MATKVKEWSQMLGSVMMAGMAVTLTDPSGPIGVTKEGPARGSALVASVCSSMPVCRQLVGHISSVVRIAVIRRTGWTNRRGKLWLLAAAVALGLSSQALAGRDHDTAVGPDYFATASVLGSILMPIGKLPIVSVLSRSLNIYDGMVIAHLIEGSPDLPEALRTERIQTAANTQGVFGSVMIPMHNFPVTRRWRPVYQAIGKCSTDNKCGSAEGALVDIVNATTGKDFREKLASVNRGINMLVAYRSDTFVYGSLNHWATPAEILKWRAGDCEDLAILKMTALAKAGIPFESMSLVVLQDRDNGVFHAVLSVSTDSGTFILDNVRSEVLLDTDLPTYLPLYSFSADRGWIHGVRPGSPQDKRRNERCNQSLCSPSAAW